jgi:hypothetical protein
MRQMLGLSEAWSGVIQDTASTTTLVALMCARERASNYSLARGGLQGEERPLSVYVSSHSHSSVEKAALLAGFGRKNLHLIANDEKYAMKPDALEAAIQASVSDPQGASRPSVELEKTSVEPGGEIPQDNSGPLVARVLLDRNSPMKAARALLQGTVTGER